MNRNLVPMTQLIERISMGPFGSDIKTECFVNAGVPVLNGGNLTTIRMNDDSFNFVTKEKANSLSKSIARRGDIVVTHRGTLGQLSYIPEDSQYEEYLISQSQFCVTLNTDLVDPIYFAYYFHSPEGQKRLLSFANYVGVPALASATTNFKNLEFPLISLGEQKEIVNKILCIENKIRNNTSICSDLESMAKLLYDYWFVQFDFPDENGRPYKSSGGKMVWNDELKREIPEGWGAVQIGELLGKYPKTTSVMRDDYKKGTIYPIIDQSKEYICGYTDDIDKVLHMKSAIVFGDHTNIAKYVNFDFARGADGTQIVSSNNQAISNYMLYLQICELPVIEQGYSRHFKFLKEQKVVMPKLEISKKYESKIDALLIERKKCIQENKELASLRNFLLPMLMNGQIKIEDVKAS